MKISNQAIQRIVQIMQGLEPTRRVSREEPQLQTRKDEVVFSDYARQIQALQKRLAETPEIRMEKVEALRRAIEQGEYTVSSQRIAERILREHRPEL